MQSRQNGLRVSMGVGVLCLVLGAAALWYFQRPVEDPDPSRFDLQMTTFADMDRTSPPPQNPVVFVGSSSIRLWPTDSLFAGLPVINRGFGGSHISDVNYHVNRVVLAYSPRTVVFYAGDNDVNDGKEPARVVADFQNFLRVLREANPECKVLFLSIKPSASRWQVWPQMQEANRLVERIAATDSLLTFVDVATGLLGSDGTPNPELFLADALHLNEAGYRVWTGILRPYLDEYQEVRPAPHD